VTARAVAIIIGLCASSGCLKERARLDVPSVSLTIETTSVEPGGTVRGVAWAKDQSGIIFFLVTASTPDSTSRVQLNRVAADSVGIDFELKVFSRAAADTPVSIRALARDNQDFEVSITDTVFVRIEGGAR
jgi:hypothetical protein